MFKSMARFIGMGATLVLLTLVAGNSGLFWMVQAQQPSCPTSLPASPYPPPTATGTAQIVGPAQGLPGQTLTFKLMDGATQLTVDRWEQVLNPDLYTGTDYVTSFCLNMQPQQDGSLQITAPAPGRYKVAAIRGSGRWETYVQIRPQRVVPAIRGASFVTHGPLDKAYASRVLALAKRAGMTWADIFQTGWIDFDSGNFDIDPYCSGCPGSMPLDDLTWLIDEVHKQGLNVSLHLGVWAKYSGTINPAYLGTFGRLPGNLYELEPVLRTLRDQNPTILAPVMQSYAHFVLQMAALAQSHQAEAMIIGDNSNDPDDPLLWGQRDQWAELLTQLRQAFSGKLWMGIVFSCGNLDDYRQDFWKQVDGIHFAFSNEGGSGPICQWPRPAVTNLTAEQMASNIDRTLQQQDGPFLPLSVQQLTGLPLIWTDIYTVNVNGVSYLGSGVYLLGDQAVVQDNQEIVDYFEALLRTAGPQPTTGGFFLYSVSLTPGPLIILDDPLQQPELTNAIANWWGGDTAYFAPCMVRPPDLLFQENFDETGTTCPLPLYPVMLSGDWAIIEDPQQPQNHVLRGSANGYAVIGSSSWTDYTLKLRVRLFGGGSNTVAMIFFRESGEGGFHAYSARLGQGTLWLYKTTPASQNLVLSSYYLPTGAQQGRWYSLAITAVGPTMSIQLDGQQVIQYTDPNAPFLNGNVSLSVYDGGTRQGRADFDDIQIDAVGR